MMKKIAVIFSLLCLASMAGINAQTSQRIIAEGAAVEKLADGFSFTEGPIADRDGNIYFTDQPNDKIYIWTVEGKLKEFGSFGRANGMFFDRDGRLLSCSDQDNQLWSIGMDGSHTVRVTDYEGKLLNG
ncbi:MAG: SMP-30/gluconolactonase/LRE family protein, partial [Tannerella sp.]|nr:SMP-30/gluconolactonase/LRE family protein [Tannerella sp.]